MKVLLLLTVFLSGVLAITAAAVGAVEKAEAPVEPQEEHQVVDMKVEAVPEAVPLEGEPEVFPAEEVASPVEEEVAAPVEEEMAAPVEEEMASPLEGRFFSCPSGWVRYKNGCYLFVTATKSWSNALAHCNSMGASLPSASNVFDYSFLQDLTMRSGQTLSWMGGFYFQTWRWLDQSAFSYSNWYTVNSVSQYQCMYTRTTTGWSNHNCANAWPSICVKRTDTC